MEKKGFSTKKREGVRSIFEAVYECVKKKSYKGIYGEQHKRMRENFCVWV